LFSLFVLSFLPPLSAVLKIEERGSYIPPIFAIPIPFLLPSPERGSKTQKNAFKPLPFSPPPSLASQNSNMERTFFVIVICQYSVLLPPFFSLCRGYQKKAQSVSFVILRVFLFSFFLFFLICQCFRTGPNYGAVFADASLKISPSILFPLFPFLSPRR